MLNAHPTLRLKDVLKRKRINDRTLFDINRIYYTYNARGALYQLLSTMPKEKGNTILLPAFHCPTIVEPVLRAGYKTLFYKINRDLTIDYCHLHQKMSDNIAAIVTIHYFGFPADIGHILQLRKKYDFYVIEDWAHSFLHYNPMKLNGHQGDMAIYSFYKLVSSYAGGGLRINIPDYPYQPSNKGIGIKQSVVIVKRLAEQIVENLRDGNIKMMLKYLERKRIEFRLNAKAFQEQHSESIISHYTFSHGLSTARIPWFMKKLLYNSDFENIALSRRQNYALINDVLREHVGVAKLYKELPGHVCPWAYPVVLDERDRHDHILRKLGIPVFTFGNVLHPIIYKSAQDTIQDAQYLAKSLMMIPVHQNLSGDTILKFCQTINDHFST